jgi:hypothetical protein
MGANANGLIGPPIKADDEAKTGRLREEDNAERRPKLPVPFGLLPKTPIAALQRLAGFTTRLRLCALRRAFSAMQRVRVHSVNRPYACAGAAAGIGASTALPPATVLITFHAMTSIPARNSRPPTSRIA